MTQLLHKRTAPTAVQLFDELLNDFPAIWGRDMKAFNPQVPATNIHETKEGYHLELLVPGRTKEDFGIEVEKNVLTIKFEQKEETKQEDLKTLRREFTLNSFKRSFTLGEQVQVEGIQAKYEDGILRVWLPKQEVAKFSKQIAVQ